VLQIQRLRWRFDHKTDFGKPKSQVCLLTEVNKQTLHANTEGAREE
jgi:hypothetical protein